MKRRGSVKSPPHFGSGQLSVSSWSWRKRRWHWRHSTSGSLKFSDVTAGLPDPGVHQDGGVQPNYVVTFRYNRSPPGLLDVALELDAQGAVVPSGSEAAVHLAGLEKRNPVAWRGTGSCPYRRRGGCAAYRDLAVGIRMESCYHCRADSAENVRRQTAGFLLAQEWRAHLARRSARTAPAGGEGAAQAGVRSSTVRSLGNSRRTASAKLWAARSSSLM